MLCIMVWSLSSLRNILVDKSDRFAFLSLSVYPFVDELEKVAVDKDILSV
ncbi:hypothetical protein IQ229_19390 [Nostoc cf. edaphicum LEGE 07299]|uniref:Uncharacterized protein n=1 Tax=Nostoc cf. edaphicum LEGE 07299 TaxID=2777974 RepID=A0ABR9U329_9NOSO|nr:hypothetical protein [Nostoc cf. edaphicum LEGE 07299]